MDPADSSLKIGIFGAEPWTQALRDEVETRAGIDALDIYGLSEVMGPGVACECVETKDGPVIWEDHFYPEIIDPATGEVLPDGSAGELVFTSLTKEAMPVIRYRTRDLTALLPPTARAMRRLAKITGRSDDMLIVRGVNVFPSQIEEIVVAQAQLSGQFQVTLSRDGHMDRLELAVELRSKPRPDDRRRSRGDRARAAAPDQDDDRRIGRRDRARGGRDSDDGDRQGAARDRPPSGGVNPTVTRSTPRKPVRWMD
jgi:phenylacetate-CoA ligase